MNSSSRVDEYQESLFAVGTAQHIHARALTSTVQPGLRISLRDRVDLLQRLQHPVESAELFGCDQCLSAVRLLISSRGAWRVQTYRLSYGYAIRSAVKNPIRRI